MLAVESGGGDNGGVLGSPRGSLPPGWGLCGGFRPLFDLWKAGGTKTRWRAELPGIVQELDSMFVRSGSALRV